MIVRTTVKSIQDIMRQDVGVDGDAQRISQLTWLFFLKIIDDQDQEFELTKDGYQLADPGSQFQWRSWAADPEGITGQATARLRQRRAVSGSERPDSSPASRVTAAASCATCSRTPTTT